MRPARTRRSDARVLTLLILALAGGCGRDPVVPVPAVQQVAASAPAAASAPKAVAPYVPPPASSRPIRCGVYMRNVDLHLLEGVVLRVATLEGEFVGRADGRPPIFDDPTSYRLVLEAADLSMDASSLTTLLNREAFAGEKAALRDLELRFADGLVAAKGKLHRSVDIPFSMKAAVASTADGRVRLHATGIKTAGIPMKGLLDLLGIELEDLLKTPGRGLQADGDDLLLAPGAIMPPPAMEGTVRDVRVASDRLILSLAGPSRPPARPATLPDPAAPNFIYFHGGSIRFGKLTMSDADLELVDADGRDPFDFYPVRYKAQLVAGYSKNTVRGGLRTVMPDYNDLAKGKR